MTKMINLVMLGDLKFVEVSIIEDKRTSHSFWNQMRNLVFATSSDGQRRSNRINSTRQ